MTDPVDPPDDAKPPPAPDVSRHVRLYRGQWVGVPILVLIPVLALFGVFSENRSHLESAADGLDITIDHPTRLRTGQRTYIEVRVSNRSAGPAEDVTVRFDPRYFQHSLDLLFIPAPAVPYEVTLPPLASGADGRVRVEFDPEKPWRRSGGISVSQRGRDVVHARVSTFILP
jgi:hypothetical protein